MGLFITTLFTDPFYYLAWAAVVMFSICVHEYGHARVALKLGDDTAASEGHLSLDPMVQMGPASIIMLLLIGIAWGAVPVNPGRFRSRSGAAIVSFAGPASNFLLCVVFGAAAMAAAVFMVGLKGENMISRFLALGCVANAVLFVFNMLPVPMLDGWSVFSLFFAGMRRLHPLQAQQVSWIAMLILFLTPAARVIWAVGEGLGRLVMDGWLRVFSLFV